MIGMGIPRSQSRIPRPMTVSSAMIGYRLIPGRAVISWESGGYY
jgi:hypothetical protein